MERGEGISSIELTYFTFHCIVTHIPKFLLGIHFTLLLSEYSCPMANEYRTSCITDLSRREIVVRCRFSSAFRCSMMPGSGGSPEHSGRLLMKTNAASCSRNVHGRSSDDADRRSLINERRYVLSPSRSQKISLAQSRVLPPFSTAVSDDSATSFQSS